MLIGDLLHYVSAALFTGAAFPTSISPEQPALAKIR